MTREGLEKKNPSQFYTKLQLWKFDGDHQTNNLKGIKNYPYLNLDLSFQEKKRFENPILGCRDICKINTVQFLL